MTKLSLGQRLFYIVFLSVLPWPLLCYAYVELFPLPLHVYVSILFFLIYYYVLISLLTVRLIVNPIHFSTSLLHGISSGDYSYRMRTTDKNDALGELFREVNSLANLLQSNRFYDAEENRRFQLLIDGVEIGVMVFNEEKLLTVMNKTVRKWYGDTYKEALSKNADSLGLSALLNEDNEGIHPLSFPEVTSRFIVHSAPYRQGGHEQKLVLLTDLGNPLRDEERRAWKNLIRVLSHEINNSLTPITSLADSSVRQIENSSSIDPERIKMALGVISKRSHNLVSFIDEYVTLAKLPDAQREQHSMLEIVESILKLEWAHPVLCETKTDLIVELDRKQIEQCLINLIQNSIDASLESSEAIKVYWEVNKAHMSLYILDNGSGLKNEKDVFLPFYSTKQKGSGIGLALTQSIIENHNGTISIRNREDARGCEVKIVFPV